MFFLIGLVPWQIAQGSFPQIDRTGVLVGVAAMSYYISVPIVLKMETPLLDYGKYGHGSIGAAHSYYAISIVATFQVAWGVFRTIRSGMKRIFVSISTFGIVNIFSLVMGWILAIYLRMDWTS